ncbi:hypothetical protein [Qipengyuania sp. 902]|uniref:hypothetical protein n=1 Tax=Qipengyuania sp. 902 TaxID=3417565 RepID=UPI003EBBE521
MQRIPRSAVRRLAVLALDVQEGYRAAEKSPIERTAVYRLALGYLLLTGCATVGHLSTIWKVLGHEGSFSLPACRQSHFGVTIYGIRLNVDKRLG